MCLSECVTVSFISTSGSSVILSCRSTLSNTPPKNPLRVPPGKPTQVIKSSLRFLTTKYNSCYSHFFLLLRGYADAPLPAPPVPRWKPVEIRSSTPRALSESLESSFPPSPRKLLWVSREIRCDYCEGHHCEYIRILVWLALNTCPAHPPGSSLQVLPLSGDLS